MNHQYSPGLWQSFLIISGFSVIALVVSTITVINFNMLEATHEELMGYTQQTFSKTAMISSLHSQVQELVWSTYQMLDKGVQSSMPNEQKRQMLLKRIMLAVQMAARNQATTRWHNERDYQQLIDIISKIEYLSQQGQYAAAWEEYYRGRDMADHLLHALENLKENYQNALQHSRQQAYTQYQHTWQQMLSAGILGGALCIMIIMWVIYRVIVREKALYHTQLALEEAKENLETKVAERTADLLEARNQAMAASKAKSRFLANMSHELRTPLNAIIGYSDSLCDEWNEMRQEEVQEDLKKINIAGQHLLDAFSDILDISRIEAGRMNINPEAFELRSFIKQLVKSTQPLIKRNQNQLKLEYHVTAEDIYTDKLRLKQILFNLLNNAARYTEQGLITLQVEQRRIEQHIWILFRITDTGMGIAKDQLEELFNPFTQADNSATRKYDGTGLGLALSQRFCQMLGGSISVESQPGQGSVFTARLPLYALLPSKEEKAAPEKIIINHEVEENIANIAPQAYGAT